MKTFKRTCDKPYDRQWYKLWCVDGSVKILDNYEDVLTAWWNFPQHCSHVEVIDAKRSKTSGSGF